MKIRRQPKVLSGIFVFLIAAVYCLPVSAQILGSASLNVERRAHTATQLADGRILIVGGENAAGPVGQAEIFDPNSQIFSPLANSVARTDHTATLLANGRVLITGGRDSHSSLDSTEIFNPATSAFSPGPLMQRARAGHSATVLADGRILFVGGDADGSAEVYDPDTQSFSLLGAHLEIPRSLHGAVLLQDGRVLIAGGVDPGNSSAVLDSAEIFDPQSLSFSPASTPMMIARGLPTLRVLPDGKVQVIGGDAGWSMEMFNPETASFNSFAQLPPTADLLSATLSTQSRAALITTTIAQNPAVQGALTDQQLSELLDRADHSLTELAQSNQALVAGGINSSGEFLTSSVLVSSSLATVTTDRFDYPPGQIVTITGRGWQPGGGRFDGPP
jgi:phosphatidylserine/phosphatidylglycerophosphate/cardiolipin synthase-like enzyme